MLAIRPGGPDKIRKRCGVTLDKDLAAAIKLSAASVSRILSGKATPSNRFIAGIIDHCGLKFSFDHVFEVRP